MAEKSEKKGGIGKDFKAFITKGNALDMAVGIIIGVAFGLVINSMVSDVLMPPIGLATGGADFKDSYVVLKAGKWPGPYTSLKNATDAGANTLRIGVFVNTIINFLIVAFCIFMLVRQVGKMRAREEAKKAAEPPTEKECPHCQLKIPIKAIKCGHCTSDLTEG